MIAKISGSGAILKNHTLKTAVVCLAHRCVNTDIRSDSGQNNIFNALLTKDQLQICRTKASLARLVNNDLALLRIKLRNDIPAFFSTDKNPSLRSLCANFRADLCASPALIFRKIRQIRAMPLSGVDDRQTLHLSGCRKQPFDRLDRTPRQGNIISHGIHITTLSAEIRLHINDHQCGVVCSEISVIRPLVRFRIYIHHNHRSSLFTGKAASHIVIRSSSPI